MGSATRREVEIELKGKKYTLRELDLDEYGQIENFIRSKLVRLYRDSADGIDRNEREEMVMKILKSSLTPEEVAEQMSTMDCVRYATYLALRHNPGMTLESISDIVDLSNISEVRLALDSIGDEGDKDVNPPIPETENP